MRENLVLISGYGAPGEEDIALYSVSASGAGKAFGMTHGRAPSFCCRGENGLIYAASEREDGSDITAYALENGALCAVRTPAASSRSSTSRLWMRLPSVQQGPFCAAAKAFSTAARTP